MIGIGLMEIKLYVEMKNDDGCLRVSRYNCLQKAICLKERCRRCWVCRRLYDVRRCHILFNFEFIQIGFIVALNEARSLPTIAADMDRSRYKFVVTLT